LCNTTRSALTLHLPVTGVPDTVGGTRDFYPWHGASGFFCLVGSCGTPHLPSLSPTNADSPEIGEAVPLRSGWCASAAAGSSSAPPPPSPAQRPRNITHLYRCFSGPMGSVNKRRGRWGRALVCERRQRHSRRYARALVVRRDRTGSGPCPGGKQLVTNSSAGIYSAFGK
jgi:hypothetical protein